MKLRAYKPSDAVLLTELFYNTVHTVNKKDYTKEQLDVWADGRPDIEKWNASLLSHRTFVAVEDDPENGQETIVGFGDIDETGYLDRLYVHKDYQGRGIGAALCGALEACVSESVFCIRVHASITARPFFEKRGYQAVREQQVERGGILLTNFQMEKPLIRH